MALPANIPITYGGFQKGFVLESATPNPTAAAANMVFVNDGYTLLYVSNGNEDDSTCTVYGVPDNAGRTVAWTFPLVIDAGDHALLGPFRPIWWNQGGVVNVSFDVTDTVTVQAVSIQI